MYGQIDVIAHLPDAWELERIERPNRCLLQRKKLSPNGEGYEKEVHLK